MKVNFYLSNLNITAKKHAFSQIAKAGNNENVIILTPDRNTLNIEKEILNELGKKAVFNLNVTTFSRVAKSYLVDKGLYRNVLTKHASIALIKKILLEIKEELLVFKNNIEKEGFCKKIFETICLYKSCKIEPKDFYVSNNSSLLNYKLHDIKLIYSKYEEYFENEFTDSFNQLDLFEKSINIDDYKDIDFYMVDFEDITPSIARVIAKLAKSARSFNVCTTYSKALKDVKNVNLFTNDIYYNLKNVFDLSGVSSANIYVESKNEISKKVFGVNTGNKNELHNKISLDLISANNINEELNAVLSKIKKNVLDGHYKYSDISFVVSNLEDYKQELIKSFEKFDIDYYLDESDKLSNNILCKIVLLILEIAVKGLTKYNILSLIDSGIFRLSMAQINEYKSYVQRIDAKGKFLYIVPDGFEVSEDLKEVMNCVCSFVEKLTMKKSSVMGYKEWIENLFEFLKFEDYYEFLYSKYVSEGNVVNAKKLSQSYNKLSEMWNEMEMLFKNDEIEIKNFYSIFKEFVEDISLSLPPIKLNSLVVLDFNNSYIEEKDYIYFVGASDSALPKYTVETALLADKEIEAIEQYNKLTPTINLINKRKKFKLYESLFKAKKGIVFSFVCVDSKGETLFPTTAFVELAKYIEPVLYKTDYKCEIDESREGLISNNITKRVCLDNMVGYIKEWELFNTNPVFRRNVSSIQHAIGISDINIVSNCTYTNEVKNIARPSKLFFRSSEVSPSQFEKFATCPYAHFLSYGLRLKEKEKARVSTNDIGNIIHDYLNLILFDLNNYKYDEEFASNINSFVSVNLNKVLSQSKYLRFVNADINLNLIRSLKNEVERLTFAIVDHLKNSNFEPTYCEHKFSVNDGGAIKIKLKNGKALNVIGKVDRVDEDKETNSFIVVDYKTGNSSFSDFTEFVSGKKVQLFVYLKMFKNMTNKTPVGSFYLPIDNKLNSNNKYKYQGFFVNNDSVIAKIDNQLKNFPSTGKILRLSKKADGSFYKGNVADNLAISQKAIENSLEYLEEAMCERAEKIMEGVIDITPLNIYKKSPCKFCAYKGICNFNTKYKNRYRKVEKVAKLSGVIDVEESYDASLEEEDV